ncbi:hypothetical protein BH09ACT6_BH09ACT6_08070 [soil metagenome]
MVISEAAEYIDSTLQREATWERARIDGEVRYYGASVGAIRGTIRDIHRRYPGMQHDAMVNLASELWADPVFERRLAAIVLLQSRVPLLDNSDLTRIEGFIRSARLDTLIDPLVADVLTPLIALLDGLDLARATSVLTRWASDEDPSLGRVGRSFR